MKPRKSKNGTVYEPLGVAQRLVAWIFVLVAVWYLEWRLGSFNPDALLFSWVVYLAEVFGFATALLHLFMTWRLTERTAPQASSGLSVDIFVPTINAIPCLQ